MPLLKENSAAAKNVSLQKYQGLLFSDDYDGVLYTISSEKMFWKPYRGGGWCVVGEPPEYDGHNDDVLQKTLINGDCLVVFISQAEQPPLLNVEMIQNDKTGSENSSTGGNDD